MTRGQLTRTIAGSLAVLAAVACHRTEAPPPPSQPAAVATSAEQMASPEADTTPSTAPPRTIWSYRCNDGTSLTAEPLDPSGDLVVTTPDRSARMWLVERRAAATSYAGTRMQATLTGDSMTLTIDGRPRLTCQRQASSARP